MKRATAKNGDKITIPHLIFQVVYVEEKKVIIKKVVSDDEDEEDEDSFFEGGDPPNNLPGKILHIFKYKEKNMLKNIKIKNNKIYIDNIK